MLPQAQAEDTTAVPAGAQAVPWAPTPVPMDPSLGAGQPACMGMMPPLYRGFAPDGMGMYMAPATMAPTAEGGMCSGPLLRTGATLHDVQPMRQMPFGDRGQRNFNGWTVIWVGDRPPKSQAVLKEQIEAIGFLVKNYRSSEKCSRALDKKALLPGTSVFVIWQGDAPAMLTYLQGRGASGLRIIIEQDPNSYPEELPVMPDCFITWAANWDEVLVCLEAVSREASCQLFALPPTSEFAAEFMPAGDYTADYGVDISQCGADLSQCGGSEYAPMAPYGAAATLCPMPAQVSVGSAPCGCSSGQVTSTVPSAPSFPVAPVSSSAAPGTGAADQDRLAAVADVDGADEGDAAAVGGGWPWTLIWISEQAFKPAAAPLKKQLETLGGQVKGYKTNKNATRALDKKRALTRTIVLVSGAEASAFMQYLGTRKELANTRVVVEASNRSPPVRATATCEIAEDFDQSLAIIRQIANDAEFR